MTKTKKPSKSGVEKAGLAVSDPGEGDDAAIGRAFTWSLAAIVPIVALVVAVVIWVNAPKPTEEETTSPLSGVAGRQYDEVEIPAVVFADITREAGINFVHENGASGEKLLPETMGGGAAFFDFDNDGDQDLLLINSNHWPWDQADKGPPPTMALYANNGDGTFEDVTKRSGLAISLYGMGVAVGDYDNDGWRDVFLSAVGGNRLLRNEKGKFTDVTEAAGVAGSDNDWSTGCGWLDYNNDGLLDLFVCNYLAWTKAIDLAMESTLDGINRAYGRPTDFEGQFPSLYRNDGNGRFTDVSAAAGVQVKNRHTGVPASKALGVIFVDLDGDHWIDIVVANDTVDNQVFRNLGDGTFREMGLRLGLAVATSGKPTGAMGLDSVFFRDDQSIAITIGNFLNEPSSLYVTQQTWKVFSDEAMGSGLGPETLQELTFGTFFFDYDLDGRSDIFAANGHLEDEINKIQPNQHYQQPPQLFWNAGPESQSEFVEVKSDKVGPDFHKPIVGRGAAFADIDADGDLDVVIAATGSAPRLLRNDQKLGHHWLRFRLAGSKSNRDAIGAWVEVHLGDQVLRQQVAPTRSYLVQCESIVTFGLGTETQIDKAVVVWPDGSTQEVACAEVDRLYEVQQEISETMP